LTLEVDPLLYNMDTRVVGKSKYNDAISSCTMDEKRFRAKHVPTLQPNNSTHREMIQASLKASLITRTNKFVVFD
jgi:hypothetical protein